MTAPLPRPGGTDPKFGETFKFKVEDGDVNDHMAVICYAKGVRRTPSRLQPSVAIDETVILLTLSLHHYDKPTKCRGGCSRMTVSSGASLQPSTACCCWRPVRDGWCGQGSMSSDSKIGMASVPLRKYLRDGKITGPLLPPF